MRDSSILIRDREVLEISKGKPYRGNRVPSADARDVPAKQKGLPIDPRSDENHRKWVQYPTVIQDPISKKIRLYYCQASCLRNLHLMGGETFTRRVQTALILQNLRNFFPSNVHQ